MKRSLGIGLLFVTVVRGVAAQDTIPEPVLVELQLGRLASRTVQASRVRTEVLLPLTQVLELAEIRFRLSAEGRLQGTVDPGGVRLVVDAVRDSMSYGAHRVRIEPEFKRFSEGELYIGSERLGDLLGSPFAVNWPELTVTLVDPSSLPIARRLRREAARAALAQRREGPGPDLALGRERPRWDGLVFDYSLLTPSGDPVAGAGYTLGLGADAVGGSLQVAVASVGRADAGEVRTDASWTGVWRDSRWVKQLRLGDGASTGPRGRPMRGGIVTNAPFVRPSLLGNARYEGRLEPGWSLEAYRGGDLVAFGPADPSGRFTIDVPVRYGENPVDFVAYGPFGEIREFNRTYRVISELLPARRFEYGISAGSCRSPLCAATGNLDLRYGVAARWTAQAGFERFWRDTLPDLFHPYVGLAGSVTNAWVLHLEAVRDAYARGGMRYEPSINLRLGAEYARFTAGGVAPILASTILRSQAALFAFLRPMPAAGFFFLDGSLDRTTTAAGTNTRARLGASVQSRAVRLLPLLRLERDAPRAAESATRSFVGLETFILPRPELGRALGQLWVRTATELEVDGGLRLHAYSASVARPLSPGIRAEVGISWTRGTPDAALRLVLTSYLPMARSYTAVTAGAGGPVTGTQYVQGSLLWTTRQGVSRPPRGPRSNGPASPAGSSST